MSWDTDHYTYKCSDGDHDSFWKTIIESSQWVKWEKENHRRFRVGTHSEKGEWLGFPVFDIDEVRECGWISQDHFQEFLKFIIKNG